MSGGAITVRTEVYPEAQQCAAWLSRAEEGAIKLPATVANAIVFYHAAMAKCLKCQSGQRCEIHGTEALRPSATEPDIPAEQFQRITSVYFACFAEVRGQRPTFGPREGVAVKRLVREAGVDRAESAIRSAFADPYWRNKSTILTIASDPSKHLGNGALVKSTLQADSGFESHAKEVR